MNVLENFESEYDSGNDDDHGDLNKWMNVEMRILMKISKYLTTRSYHWVNINIYFNKDQNYELNIKCIHKLWRM